ncbi:MAG: DNA repair protein RadC [Bacteroidaceae bacterium]|nr:DNA repair protein RadC [Bacteroidaceae bacterium]MBR6714501.1 DNA repair protein RadC [Bacteroidaceae bacterium]
MSVSLKKRSEDSRPRERLLRNGAASLSTAELLAILIGSGTTQKDAVQLMGEVLEYCGNDLTQLGRITYEELTGFKGIGKAKAITVLAALEFARRRMDASPTKKREFRDSSDLYDFFRPLMCDKDHEVFWVLLLNNRLQYVDDRCLSQGDIKGTVVEPRMVFNYVVTKQAVAFAVAHNHPSGNPNPSRDDDNLTKRLAAIAKELGVRFIDHIIVCEGQNKYYSFSEQGKI